MNNHFKSLVICLAATALTILAKGQGFLKTDGPRIVNEQGENVLLRGMGLGGWMLQEGYMLGLSGGGQQHVIRQKIADLIGEVETAKFYELWLANHTSRIDIDSLKAWGFNSVRLPMHYNLYTLPSEQEPIPGQHTWLSKGFELTDSLLAWCKANRMYLILDLHAAPGGQGNDVNISDRDPSKPFLWESQANQEKVIALWRKLAEKYAAEPWVAAYDILNEPNFGFEDPTNDPNGIHEKKNEPLRDLYIRITEAIREVDQNHIIVIEGNGWGNNYNGVLPLWDNNMVLSFHKYWNNNDDASISHMVEARAKNNAPIWLGETGENSNVWFTSCIDLLERNNIGWAMWPLKKLGMNNPLEVKTNPEYAQLLDYWKNKGPRPDSITALRGVMQLASDLKLSSNTYHPDVIDAMMRQPHSNETKPFKRHQVGLPIAAADYDLGRIGRAYYDLDSANYRVVQGQQGGNKGRTYRNDGVDLTLVGGQVIVNNIEPGEWLQYTINIPRRRIYSLALKIKGGYPADFVAVSTNGRMRNKIMLADYPDRSNWQIMKIRIPLEKGRNAIRLTFQASDLEFRELLLTP